MNPDTAAAPGPRVAAEASTARMPSSLRDLLRGASLIFDFTGAVGRRRVSTTRIPSDVDRLASDWNSVGDDLRRAMGNQPS